MFIMLDFWISVHFIMYLHCTTMFVTVKLYSLSNNSVKFSYALGESSTTGAERNEHTQTVHPVTASQKK